jgi:putative phosphoribosyl transferase
MAESAALTTPVRISADDTRLDGDLTLPPHARGIVLFAHGSGSSRRSPRNKLVAEGLHRHHLASLLVDLLTPDEEVRDARTRDLPFDIGLLADRLVGIVDWLAGEPETAGLPVGLFGASTGAAAALVTAASRPDVVLAVVARGGRPDLAGPALIQVTAPVLLLVGELDLPVRVLNEQARRALTTRSELHIVPGAGHLFEEPGALDLVTEHAAAWFTTYLRGV